MYHNFFLKIVAVSFCNHVSAYDSAICGSNGTLRNILELICNEPVEFNFLRLDHGLNREIRKWLTGPNNIYCDRYIE